MAYKYVNFISDEHLLNCIGDLHKAHLRAKNNITKKNFYSNKVDTIKLTFDAQFNNISEEDLIQSEILRQIDKSINNSIGTFHEKILGGIEGFEIGNLSGFDVKAKDDSLFAIFGTKDIAKNISDAVFEKLANTGRIFRKSTCYYVLLDDFSTTNEKWIIGNEEYHVSSKCVFKTSIRSFYNILSGDENAFDQLTKVLPNAIKNLQTNLQPS